MGDEQCFQTTAPEAWFGWALGSGVVAVLAGVLVFGLWLPRESESVSKPRSRKQRVAAGVLTLALLAVSMVNLSTMSRDEAVGMPRPTIATALLVAPVVGIGIWGARSVRAGRPLSHRQQVALACARVVTIVTAAGAGIAAIGIFAAYMASSVQVACSTIPT